MKINNIPFLLLIAVVVSAQQGARESDNVEADSQTQYRYISVPVKSVKYISPFGRDSIYDLKPAYKSHSQSIYATSPKTPKIHVFSPNPKFIAYANYRQTNSGSKGTYSKFASLPKKYQIFYKPIHPNFNSDLALTKLPISGIQHFRYPGYSNPDLREFKNNFKLQDVPNLYSLQQEFLESASPKQVEQYLEAQQKEMDEKTELQLLNDPNPAAKGIYQQFLKAKEDEKIEKEYIEELQKRGHQPGTSYVPVNIEERETIKKTVTPGLRHYRTAPNEPSAYEFEILLR